jgi:hypothetical protein
MRLSVLAMTLAGGIGWAGCYTAANLGGTKVIPLGTVVPGTACSQNSECTSGLCLGQNCCTQATCGTDVICGGTSCDATGACVYPPATTSCAAQACAGHTLTESASCNGAGVCSIPTPATADCAPYSCGTTGNCLTVCGASGDCSSGFCQVATGACCPAYTGNQIEVDGTQGVDVACCGGDVGAKACATIAYAVGLVSGTGTAGMTVHVANPPNGTDWSADAFPIQLSYGVILNAPGVAFSNVQADSESFLIQPFGLETATSAVIEGSATQPISIGVDSIGNLSPATGIYVSPPMTLFLLNASVHDWLSDAGSCNWEWHKAPNTPCNSGIWVRPGATLTLGSDGHGTSGTVAIGDATAGVREMTGILCEGLPSVDGGAALVATVTDVGSSATPSVWIQNQLFGLAAFDGCTANLRSSPRFGWALNAEGTCDPSRHPYAARTEIYLTNSYSSESRPYGLGSNFVTLSNATLECSQSAFEFDSYGSNSVTADNDIIQYNDVGVYFGFAGSFRASNSTISHNAVGVFGNWSDGVFSPSVDLSLGGNQITCNDSLDTTPGWSDPGFGAPTAGMVLTYSASLATSHVSWNHWDADAGHVQTWACEPALVSGAPDYSNCTCSGASDCPALPPDGGPMALPGSGVDIVYQTGTNPAIDDANGSAATGGCP